MAALVELLGDKVQGKAGSVDVSSLEENDLVGIYFSAHWCPPCRGFTPELAKRYTAIKALGKKIEIVFASSDKDQVAFDEYYGEMPWLAIPFDKQDKKKKLSEKYSVSGIPTLVFVNPKNGETVTKDGRRCVMVDTTGEKFPNYPVE